MTQRLLAAALLMAAITGCDLTTGPGHDVNASIRDGGVVIANRSSRPIYYFAVEQERAALILWGPCDDPELCDSVAAGGTEVLPLDSISGYSPEASHILVYWWRLIPDDSGYRAGEVHVKELPL